MLSLEDVADCLEIAVRVFPNYPLDTEQVYAYHQLLDDLDKNALYEAVKEVLKTSPFFPTVAQIREVALAKPTYTPQTYAPAIDAPKGVPMPDWFKKQMGDLFKMPAE
jgi:hypothetical protein